MVAKPEVATCVLDHSRQERRSYTAKVVASRRCIATVLVSIDTTTRSLLADDSTPFVCLVCIQMLHKAEIRSLHKEIEELKSVCQELRAELQATKEVAAAAVCPTAATSIINEIHEAAAFQALKKDVENIQATLESQSKSYATAVKIGKRNEYRPVKQPNNSDSR